MYHKEIFMVVGTAKFILGALPQTSRLVVVGIDGEYQHSTVDLADAISQKDWRCMVLFPSEDAKTFEELQKEKCITRSKFER
jgi:DTW domain-containing protein YfiP